MPGIQTNCGQLWISSPPHFCRIVQHICSHISSSSCDFIRSLKAKQVWEKSLLRWEISMENVGAVESGAGDSPSFHQDGTKAISQHGVNGHCGTKVSYQTRYKGSDCSLSLKIPRSFWQEQRGSFWCPGYIPAQTITFCFTAVSTGYGFLDSLS